MKKTIEKILSLHKLMIMADLKGNSTESYFHRASMDRLIIELIKDERANR